MSLRYKCSNCGREPMLSVLNDLSIVRCFSCGNEEAKTLEDQKAYIKQAVAHAFPNCEVRLDSAGQAVIYTNFYPIYSVPEPSEDDLEAARPEWDRELT